MLLFGKEFKEKQLLALDCLIRIREKSPTSIMNANTLCVLYTSFTQWDKKFIENFAAFYKNYHELDSQFSFNIFQINNIDFSHYVHNSAKNFITNMRLRITSALEKRPPETSATWLKEQLIYLTDPIN